MGSNLPSVFFFNHNVAPSFPVESPVLFAFALTRRQMWKVISLCETVYMVLITYGISSVIVLLINQWRNFISLIYPVTFC